MYLALPACYKQKAYSSVDQLWTIQGLYDPCVTSSWAMWANPEVTGGGADFIKLNSETDAAGLFYFPATPFRILLL